MFILFLFIVIFSIVIISINKGWINNQTPAIIKKELINNQPPAIIKKDLPDTTEPVFQPLSTQISSGEDMAAKQPPKLPKINAHEELSLEHEMNNTRIETSSQPSSPRSPRGTKSSGKKINCLCAPTNHPGSFRCRYHRNSQSVGSNLSELAFRKTASVGSNLSDLGNSTTDSGMKRSRRPKEC